MQDAAESLEDAVSDKPGGSSPGDGQEVHPWSAHRSTGRSFFTRVQDDECGQRQVADE